eukprot:12598957-Heterocapsa_arctica.AAC.1
MAPGRTAGPGSRGASALGHRLRVVVRGRAVLTPPVPLSLGLNGRGGVTVLIGPARPDGVEETRAK